MTRRLAGFLIAAALLGGGCGEEPKFRSTDITNAPFAREFSLTDHNGKTRTLADFKGQVVAVFFGYTQCPDFCPTTLAELANAARLLGADAAKFQALFVTVDPERDTPELLSSYVPAFNPSFLGLYGDAAALKRVAQEFKAIYQKESGKDPASYTMAHSIGIYVFDPAGRIRLFMKHEQGAEAIAHDLRLLIAGK